MRPGGIAGVRVKIDRLTCERRVQVWVRDLARHRRRIEGKRVGGREVDRRRVQSVIGEDVQPDDGLPQHVRRDPQDRVQQQGLNGEELGREERRADRHARISRRQLRQDRRRQSALVLDPRTEIGGVARRSRREIDERHAKP